MQCKLKFHWEHYLDNDTQICLAKNCYRSKAPKHLPLYLYADSLILFEIIDDLFTKLEKVYGNSYCKKYTKEKFRESKIGSESFNTFYSEFIKLVAKLKFRKEILL